jgi:hypothetical protein
MELQMGTSGFAWTFWNATDGNDFEKDHYKGWFAGRYYECPWLSQARGTWACAISHIRLWHALLGTPPKDGVAFIFEDDAEIRPGMADRWPEIEGELPNDWDFVFFGPWDRRCIDDHDLLRHQRSKALCELAAYPALGRGDRLSSVPPAGRHEAFHL